MGGYHLTRVGAAGTPLERGNYYPKVLANYDHVVADMKAESPCGRLVIMAGMPGTGKTYLVRSLLSDIPKAAFVIVPSHMVKELGSPELLPALASARRDGLDGPMALIIEDADKVLVNREAGDMAAIRHCSTWVMASWAASLMFGSSRQPTPVSSTWMPRPAAKDASAATWMSAPSRLLRARPSFNASSGSGSTASSTARSPWVMSTAPLVTRAGPRPRK